jgi:hypothetical protein
MRTEVLATNRADQQIKRLTRRHAKTFDDFVNDLAARGLSMRSSIACSVSRLSYGTTRSSRRRRFRGSVWHMCVTHVHRAFSAETPG